MMKITHKMIRDDAIKIAGILRNTDMEIPSSWQCLKPGLALMLGIIIWQYFLVFCLLNSHDYHAVFMSGGMGFILFLMVYSTTSKYLSLPKEIRDNSIIISIYKKMAAMTLLIWAVFNIVVELVVSFFVTHSFMFVFIQYVSSVVMVFLFSINAGRYDLSLFSSIISAWQAGKEIDIEALENKVTPK